MARRPKLDEEIREDWRAKLITAVRFEIKSVNGILLPDDRPVVGFDELVEVVRGARPELAKTRVYEIANEIASGNAYDVYGGPADEPVTMASSADYYARFKVREDSAVRREELRQSFIEWGKLGPLARR